MSLHVVGESGEIAGTGAHEMTLNLENRTCKSRSKSFILPTPPVLHSSLSAAAIISSEMIRLLASCPNKREMAISLF